MAIKYENECVGCDLPCVNCGRKSVKHLYCDNCGNDCETLYIEGSYELCEECLLKTFDKITL